ncbi:MAG: RluA family pseudouridine synthase [Planctomycetes bacterium]|nr:RluA family pseudouridine synthase [Planctomycetota bacterium]
MGIFGKERDLTRAPERVELRVDCSSLRMKREDVDIRLDAFLAHHLDWRSRSSLQHLIRDGFVLVDPSTPDKPEGRGELQVETRPGRKLRHGSRVAVKIPEELRLPMLAESTDELCVLYEDECMLAVDKPAPLVVHPSGRYLSDTLIQRVHKRYGEGFELERGGAPRLCHRLDRETSGVVLIGKNPIAHADVMGQFERREVAKEYRAIVRGVPERDGGTIDMPMGPARVSKIELKMTIAVDGQPSRTDWRVLERLGDCALVACVPYTGRQHQIRVHMAEIGHPLVGDKLYGEDDSFFERSLEGELTRAELEQLGMERHALHNHMLGFRTPATGEWVEVRSPLPADMQEYLDLRRG